MGDRELLSRPAEISVIVVNYGTAELASAAVQSVLARNHGGRAVDVHLVDNASPGADRETLSARAREEGWRDRVTFYPEEVNHGFGRGNNLVLSALAARDIPPRYVFLLNPDARLENEALDILAGVLDATPKVAFAGAGISKPESGPVTAAFRFPTFASECIQALSFGPLSRMFKGYSVPLPHDQPRGPVGWVAGAAVTIRFEALLKIGFFDFAYFLYFEEVDLCAGQRQTGGKLGMFLKPRGSFRRSGDGDPERRVPSSEPSRLLVPIMGALLSYFARPSWIGNTCTLRIDRSRVATNLGALARQASKPAQKLSIRFLA